PPSLLLALPDPFPICLTVRIAHQTTVPSEQPQLPGRRVSNDWAIRTDAGAHLRVPSTHGHLIHPPEAKVRGCGLSPRGRQSRVVDRKSTRLNSSHQIT